MWTSIIIGYYFRKLSLFFLGLLLVYLSIPVVQNLLSSKQMMNTSFDSLRIVNSYGAFGRYMCMCVYAYNIIHMELMNVLLLYSEPCLFGTCQPPICTKTIIIWLSWCTSVQSFQWGSPIGLGQMVGSGSLIGSCRSLGRVETLSFINRGLWTEMQIEVLIRPVLINRTLSCICMLVCWELLIIIFSIVSVTKERTEVILEGTADDRITSRTNWIEIEFKCKPGSLHRRPCIISPYHYRLDWLMWFSAFQSYQHNPWLLHLTGKILAGDPVVQSLLVSNYPFTDEPPK